MAWDNLASIVQICINIAVILFLIVYSGQFKFIVQSLDLYYKHCSERGKESFNRDICLAWEIFKLKHNLTVDDANDLYEHKLYKEWGEFTEKIYHYRK